MGILGNFIKNCLHSEWKKNERAQSMEEKNFLPPGNHDTPSPGKIFSKSVLDIRTRLAVTVEPETK